MLLIRRLPSMANSAATTALSWRCSPPTSFISTPTKLTYLKSLSLHPKLPYLSLCSISHSPPPLEDFSDSIPQQSSKRVRHSHSFICFVFIIVFFFVNLFFNTKINLPKIEKFFDVIDLLGSYHTWFVFGCNTNWKS